jgi:alkylation response protein AidB-like acyl-CoA dehydrogenase
MNFELGPEQSLLAESVGKLLDRTAGTARPAASDRWTQFADMGLLGLPYPLRLGGFDGAGPEAMIVMQAIGRSLAVEPYLSCILLAGMAVVQSEDSHHEPLISRLIGGTCKLTLAHTEPQSRYELNDVATTARRDGDGWILSGSKIAVLDAAGADMLLVSARTAGDRCDEHGATLFLVRRNAPRLSLQLRAGPDGRSSGACTLDAVLVSDDHRVGSDGDAIRIIRMAVDRAIAGACAEAVGAMERVLDMTVDYLKTRRQFGTTIGSFQALQHRAADMLVELEQARSMAMYAALMVAEPDSRARRAAIAAAKVQVSAAARFVGQQAIQLHGGIGMSEECPVGGYFKRLTLFERLFGDESHFLREIDRCGGIEH